MLCPHGRTRGLPAKHGQNAASGRWCRCDIVLFRPARHGGNSPRPEPESPVTESRLAAFQTLLRELYEGETHRAHKYRYALLGLDIVTILFIIVTSFLPRGDFVEAVDVLFG